MSFCNWTEATPSDKALFVIISRLLNKHPKLLPFIFHPKEPILGQSPEILIQQARAFSSGELLLVRLAIDIWSQDSSVGFMEVVWNLDPENFENTLAVLRMLRPEQKCRALSS
jgi:hypothetical protein